MMIALTPRIPICRTAQYFNPHFRKGSDSYSHPHADFTNISIHTSAREVTMCCNGIRWYKWFQSTLPQGKWPLVTRINGFSLQISIHTSAREVTSCIVAIDGSTVFQSTLPQGKWRRSDTDQAADQHFNPHFRKGSDREHARNVQRIRDFNPHFRKGSDDLVI